MVKGRILDQLGNFEIQRRPAIDHTPAMAFQPGKNAGRHLRRIAVATGVRRRAHPVIEHTLRRRLGQRQVSIGHVPVHIGKTARLKGVKQWSRPVGIFMDHMDRRDGPRCIGNRHVLNPFLRSAVSQDIE